jgi:hypothetical protein
MYVIILSALEIKMEHHHHNHHNVQEGLGVFPVPMEQNLKI